LPTQESVALEDSCIPIGQAYFPVFKPVYWPLRIVPPMSAVPIGKTANALESTLFFKCTHQVTKGKLAFATHNVIHIRVAVRLWSQAGVVTAENDFCCRVERAHQLDDSHSSTALKRHYGKPDYVRIKLVH